MTEQAVAEILTARREQSRSRHRSHCGAGRGARLGRNRDRARCARLRRHRRAAVARTNARRSPRSMRRRGVPQPGGHGAARLRPRRVQVFRLSAAARWSRRCARRSTRRSPRSPTAGTKRSASTTRYPAEHADVPRALPRRRADAADAAAAAIRRRRLQLPAPGPLRRARVSAAGRPCCCRAPGDDFTGGEFVLTEQRPRMQSRAEVVPLAQGEAVIFPVHHRPGAGHARHLPRQHAPRREPRALRARAYARRHLPRREVTAMPRLGGVMPGLDPGIH